MNYWHLQTYGYHLVLREWLSGLVIVERNMASSFCLSSGLEVVAELSRFILENRILQFRFSGAQTKLPFSNEKKVAAVVLQVFGSSV